mmetsp:Transcript_7498/g.34165  ORF Transcript_7498/g.34165 Transcript_7498/m.34165 type:complete len:255 (-) Transcript_7498:699-1463(-)
MPVRVLPREERDGRAAPRRVLVRARAGSLLRARRAVTRGVPPHRRRRRETLRRVLRSRPGVHRLCRVRRRGHVRVPHGGQVGGRHLRGVGARRGEGRVHPSRRRARRVRVKRSRLARDDRFDTIGDSEIGETVAVRGGGGRGVRARGRVRRHDERGRRGDAGAGRRAGLRRRLRGSRIRFGSGFGKFGFGKFGFGRDGRGYGRRVAAEDGSGQGRADKGARGGAAGEQARGEDAPREKVTPTFVVKSWKTTLKF